MGVGLSRGWNAAPDRAGVDTSRARQTGGLLLAGGFALGFQLQPSYTGPIDVLGVMTDTAHDPLRLLISDTQVARPEHDQTLR